MMLRRKKGQRGFTLIELLIVVAILGVLAAVVIPNVGRFLGTGEAAAKDTELHNVQSAVVAMMTDNGITKIDTPVAATGNMTVFPATANNAGVTTALGSKNGYLLRGHDKDKSNGTQDNINYVTFDATSYCYTVNTSGDVTQPGTKWTGSPPSCQ